jgi:hypothetical protein
MRERYAKQREAEAAVPKLTEAEAAEAVALVVAAKEAAAAVRATMSEEEAAAAAEAAALALADVKRMFPGRWKSSGMNTPWSPAEEAALRLGVEKHGSIPRSRNGKNGLGRAQNTPSIPLHTCLEFSSGEPVKPLQHPLHTP